MAISIRFDSQLNAEFDYEFDADFDYENIALNEINKLGMLIMIGISITR